METNLSLNKTTERIIVMFCLCSEIILHIKRAMKIICLLHLINFLHTITEAYLLSYFQIFLAKCKKQFHLFIP